MAKKSVLSADLAQALATISQKLERGLRVDGQLLSAISGMSEIPADAVGQAAREIPEIASLFRVRPKPVRSLFWPRLSDEQQLQRFPEFAYLCLFHYDGRLRSKALQLISGPLPSSFMFAAVVLRLNDWAEPVRSAALDCAQRCFPLTSPETIAAAANFVLLRQDSWGRWGTEREAVRNVFSRPDVVAKLVENLREARTGPGSRILRELLRWPAVDPHLETLALQAWQPAVRAVAVQTVGAMQASWRTGSEIQWIDKSMGEGRSVPRFERRPLTTAISRLDMIGAATRDGSALVRKVALDSIIRHELGSQAGRNLALPLANDPSRVVRERAAFILSRTA